MSWAAHNPEGYTECEVNAVADFFLDTLNKNGFDAKDGYDPETVKTLAESLEQINREVFDAVFTKARLYNKIGEYESEFLSRSV